ISNLKRLKLQGMNLKTFRINDMVASFAKSKTLSKLVISNCIIGRLSKDLSQIKSIKHFSLIKPVFTLSSSSCSFDYEQKENNNNNNQNDDISQCFMANLSKCFCECLHFLYIEGSGLGIDLINHLCHFIDNSKNLTITENTKLSIEEKK